MYEKFGKMDYEELIRTAAAEKAEGDKEALIVLAKENGLDQEDAEDYMDEISDVLATPYMAAVAKIEGEAEELGISGAWEDWKNILLELCTEDNGFCLAVCKKDKDLGEIFGWILKEGFEKKQRVNTKITKAAGLGPDIWIGIPSKKDVIDLARKYYGGQDGRNQRI